MASLFKNPVKWAEDTVHSAGNAVGVKNVSWETPLGRNSELSNLGSNINREWNNLSRGEIGKYFSGAFQSIYDSLLALPRTTVAAVSGGNVGKELTRGVGATADVFTGLGTSKYIGGSSGIQKTLNSPLLDTITGGLSGDYAGFTKGVSQSSSGHVDQEYLDDTLRLGGKAAVIAGGTALFESYMTPPASNVPVYPGGATMSPGIYGDSLVPGLYQSPGEAVSANWGFWDAASSLGNSVLDGAKAVLGVGKDVATTGTEALATYGGLRALAQQPPSRTAETLLYGGADTGLPDLGFLDSLFGYREPASQPVVVNEGSSLLSDGSLIKPLLFAGAAGLGIYLLVRRK